MIPGPRAWVIAIVAVVIAAAFVLASRSMRPASDRFTWRSSTAAQGYPSSGRLGVRGPYELVFHTRRQKDPWVEIDLGEPREIRTVIVRNRIECCGKRALPLIVSVALEPGAFVQVGRRDKGFVEWRARFPPRAARFVRLEVPRKTMLHLSAIEVR